MARSGCSALHRSVIKRSTDSILRVLEVDRHITSGQTSTANGQMGTTRGQTSTASG